MARIFNVTGSCNPKFHYMVDIKDRLESIKALIDRGDYFTINRARQYGKTTTLTALAEYLKNDYAVISLDFQMLGNSEFSDEITFCEAFISFLLSTIKNQNNPIDGFDKNSLAQAEAALHGDEKISLRRLFEFLSNLCATAAKPVVLLIDEVDSATNNQVFLDFLAQLRGYYLARAAKGTATFQSVILAGVYDVKNIRLKIRPDEAHKVNSPWNIAADFLVDMSFNTHDIEGMLKEYEADYHTGMDTGLIARLIYESTGGYPFLVSRICKLIDERIAGTEAFPDKSKAWTKDGYLEAEKMLTEEKNTLFDSLTGKLYDYPELKEMISAILFEGKDYPYIATNHAMEIAEMFGFIKKEGSRVRISNRIFETVLYNHLLSEEITDSGIYDSALTNMYRFTEGHKLNMTAVLEGFVKAFGEVSQGKDEKFLEEEGRKYFMLYLKPIINGTGHSYVEARTRNLGRTDIVVEYAGEQFVIELKIWRGEKYHTDGEAQIVEYLDYYNLKKGYMIVFNFNKDKEVGVKEVTIGDRVIVEAVV